MPSPEQPRSIDGLRARMDVARANLHNAGLHDSGCVAAYFAALYVGAGPELAFEAARRHQLLSIPADDDVHTQRRYQRPDEYDASQKHRREWRQRVESLPNPFSDLALLEAA